MTNDFPTAAPSIRGLALLLFGLFLFSATVFGQPAIVAEDAARIKLDLAGTGVGQVTQFALGPDGRLYASTADRGVQSFHYDSASGKLSDMRTASDVSGLGIGFQQSTGQMYLSSFDGSIYRLTDDNGDGQWGGGGETRVAIVQNLPTGDHSVNNIQVVGDSLYVGIGNRTINGGTGMNTGGVVDDFGGKGMFSGGDGNTFGESAYNGTISWIKNLNAVASTPNAAGLFTDASQSTIQTNAQPFTSTDEGKLTVFAAGARNPFGLAVDKTGSVFFTNNFNRADSNGDGTADKGLYADAVGPHLSHQVYDQFFKGVEGGDYGFRNENWRGNTDILSTDPANFQKSITFDNLDGSDPRFQQDYDPRHPEGLGPSSSADGLSFWYDSNLGDLNGNAFIARWNPSVGSSDGTTYEYSDLVAVDPLTGKTVVIADGFRNPLAVFGVDGGLLVSDYGTGSVYFLTAVPEPTTVVMMLAALPILFAAARRSRGTKA